MERRGEGYRATLKGDTAKDDLRFRDWICQIEVQFKIFNLPKSPHLFVLMCLLDSEVARFLQDVDPTKYGTYEALKQYVQQLSDSRLDSTDAHVSVFYSLKQGEHETSIRYIQRLQIELFKGQPKLKRNKPKYAKRRHGFLKERFIAGLDMRYQNLLEITNLDKMKPVAFEQLQKEAYEIDQCSLGEVYQLRIMTYDSISALGKKMKSRSVPPETK